MRRARRKAANENAAIAMVYTIENAITHTTGRVFHCRHAASTPYSENTAKTAPMAS